MGLLALPVRCSPSSFFQQQDRSNENFLHFKVTPLNLFEIPGFFAISAFSQNIGSKCYRTLSQREFRDWWHRWSLALPCRLIFSAFFFNLGSLCIYIHVFFPFPKTSFFCSFVCRIQSQCHSQILLFAIAPLPPKFTSLVDYVSSWNKVAWKITSHVPKRLICIDIYASQSFQAKWVHS